MRCRLDLPRCKRNGGLTQCKRNDRSSNGQCDEARKKNSHYNEIICHAIDGHTRSSEECEEYRSITGTTLSKLGVAQKIVHMQKSHHTRYNDQNMSKVLLVLVYHSLNEIMNLLNGRCDEAPVNGKAKGVA